MYRTVKGALGTWRALDRSMLLDERSLATARADVLRWPLIAVALACLGWLPGALLFPLVIHLVAGPVPTAVFTHFGISFSISGVIALTYSFFGVEYVVLTALYPRFLEDAPDLKSAVTKELGGIARRSAPFYLFAALLPLLAALGLVLSGEAHVGSALRALLVAFIALGMAGFALALGANHFFTSIVNVLTKHAKKSA
jgi:hypothetical protein